MSSSFRLDVTFMRAGGCSNRHTIHPKAGEAFLTLLDACRCFFLGAVLRNQHVTGSAFSNLSATALYREATLKGMQQLAKGIMVSLCPGCLLFRLYRSPMVCSTHLPLIMALTPRRLPWCLGNRPGRRRVFRSVTSSFAQFGKPRASLRRSRMTSAA